MIKVGITGFIGNGKTYTSNIFKEKYNIKLFNADYHTKQLYYDPEIQDKVRPIINTDFINEDKSINFKKIGSILFNDINLLKQVSSILHPLVYEKYELFCQENKDEKYTLFESALIYQSNNIHRFDKIILVHTELDLIIERVMKRDNCTKLDVLTKLLLQRNNLYIDQLDYKNLNHDFLIKNDNTIELQIENIHQFLSK